MLAREANIVIEDKAFGHDLQQRLNQAMDPSSELNPAHWQRRAWPRRMLSWLAYSGVRWMVGLVGGGRWV